MKYLVTLSVLFICIILSEQVAKFVNCPPGLPRQRKKYENKCLEVQCLPAHSINIFGCPVVDCIKFLGIKRGDPKKEYPDCCDRPICSNK